MSSGSEPGSDSGLQTAGAELLQAAKPSRGPGCQVCGSSLSGRYETRFKVCRTHREADEVQHNGKVQRFCQQCNTFHVTERFEGSQRSCREQLARHAERRRELRRARREAEQGRSSPSSEGANAASRRRSAGSPLRYSSAPVPLPLSLLLPGQPATAPLQPGGSNPDGSPPSKRQRSQSDALALLASMSVDQLHASKQLQLPPQQRQQSDTTQSETADLSLMLQQLVGQSGGSLPPLPQQAGLQSLLLGHPPPGSSQGFGQLSSQVDSALLQLRQQAAQQLLMLEKKQQVLRRTMDMLQHVMQPPAAAPLQLAAQPSGSLDALQLLALLQQPQPQVQPRAAQQQGDALLRMLGFGQPPQ
ncbi:hypothetical protein COHA_006161 [Chlorella ohadii]|uniref:SBP-type domain-containing protein n=1 Tax=Chlorella ohadii TaxID=2649997 RepID=A0AAD5DQG5_9CHLO|nr:hypothetical protein COHA_006161 [Chlorella ohadii]